MVIDAVARQRGPALGLHIFREAMGMSEQSPILPTHTGDIEFALPEKLPTLKEAEDLLIQEALNRSEGNQGIAAGLLGISRQALNKRLVRARERPQ